MQTNNFRRLHRMIQAGQLQYPFRIRFQSVFRPLTLTITEGFGPHRPYGADGRASWQTLDCYYDHEGDSVSGLFSLCSDIELVR